MSKIGSDDREENSWTSLQKQVAKQFLPSLQKQVEAVERNAEGDEVFQHVLMNGSTDYYEIDDYCEACSGQVEDLQKLAEMAKNIITMKDLVPSEA